MSIERAAQLIRRGGLVAFPTETVYGLGADALQPTAVARIFEAKGRPRFDPLILHVASLADAESLILSMPDAARKLAERFWPGPLTLVLPKRDHVPDIVTAGLPSVAVRVPSHPIALELIRQSGTPIAAPSANRFGSVSPTIVEHVRQELGDAVDMVLDGGPCSTGVESTVVSFIDDAPTVLRYGGLTVEEIEAFIGPVHRMERAVTDRPVAPGMLERHYAPGTKLVLVDRVEPPAAGLCAGLLTLKKSDLAARFTATEVLSPTGDLREAAANLFAAVRRLDAAGLDLIIAQRVPDEGLGRAINDRLKRAGA
ncbi:MAG: threonylcarbamoyl-AMP synthase [Planctomycetes bacterium]|nr:threonylcarbamoyl-AMP synthase [Planctomycetota bacterium]